MSDSPQARSWFSSCFCWLRAIMLRFSEAFSSACLSFSSGVDLSVEGDGSDGDEGGLGGSGWRSEVAGGDVGEKRFPSHDICLDWVSYFLPNCSIALELRSRAGLVVPDSVCRH